jgi:hypothetical protein
MVGSLLQYRLAYMRGLSCSPGKPWLIATVRMLCHFFKGHRGYVVGQACGHRAGDFDDGLHGTPDLSAINLGNLEFVRLLLDRRADVSAKDGLAIMHASRIPLLSCRANMGRSSKDWPARRRGYVVGPACGLRAGGLDDGPHVAPDLFSVKLEVCTASARPSCRRQS